MATPNTFLQSGKLWHIPRARRIARVRKVCTTLLRTYGRPRFGNPADPLDDLVYIIVSTRTTIPVAQQTFQQIKNTYGTWDDLLKFKRSRLRQLLRPAGLYEKKSAQIIGAMRMIADRFGRCDLSSLGLETNAQAEKFLTSLPGVSEKVAKCVMLYAMHRQVLPVDVHVHRVSVRLGWVDRKRADQCHSELEQLIPAKLRYGFHVGCVAHGQLVCRTRPRCGQCPVRRVCDFYKKNHASNKTNSR